MIYVSAYQRDFGRQSDDPQMALSYESQYQALLGQRGQGGVPQALRGRRVVEPGHVACRDPDEVMRHAA